jgi:membrane protease YdiL (CAAX protease family)
MALSDTAPSAALPNTKLSEAWRRVGDFYVWTTVISAAAWLPYGAQMAGVLHTDIPAIVPVLGQYSPTIAALILVAREGGFAGLVAFLRRSFSLRFGFRWVAAAVAIPLLMAGGLIALHALRGAGVPPLASLAGWPARVAQFLADPHDAAGGVAGRSDLVRMLANWAGQGAVQAALVLFGIAFANGGISEEAGWRGYALAKLIDGRRVLLVALTVGFFWGLWHTGPAFWAGLFQSNWHVFAIPLEYTLGTIPLTVMIAWLFVNVRRSLVPGMILHACYNATFFFLTQIWMPGHAVVSIPEWLLASYAAALAVVVAGRKTLFARG